MRRSAEEEREKSNSVRNRKKNDLNIAVFWKRGKVALKWHTSKKDQARLQSYAARVGGRRKGEYEVKNGKRSHLGVTRMGWWVGGWLVARSASGIVGWVLCRDENSKRKVKL